MCTWRAARDLVKVHVLAQRLAARVHLQDGDAALHATKLGRLTTTATAFSLLLSAARCQSHAIACRSCRAGLAALPADAKGAGVHEVVTCTSGRSTVTCRSKRPGRSSAWSSTSGLFVAAMTMTPVLPCAL